MGSPDLALSWKDHHGVLFTVFEKLLAKKALVDCTLAAEGKFLKAHRIVLSACSPYFEALLDQEYDKHPIIFLRDVQFEDLKTLLEFVYSGEIKIPETRLVEFLNVAEALQIKGLGGAGSESPVKQTSSKSVSRKETDSPLPRKRSRRQSSSSEGNSCDRAEIIPINSEKVRPIQSNEPKVPELSASAASVNKSNSVTEELSVDISKVKKEVINPPSSHSESQLEQDQEESNEEILGLKPEFEQVTFTEDYSDDMLPEDDDSELNQDQPSSSHQYSGFPPDTVSPGEMKMHAPYAVGSAEPSVPEGSAAVSEPLCFSAHIYAAARSDGLWKSSVGARRKRPDVSTAMHTQRTLRLADNSVFRLGDNSAFPSPQPRNVCPVCHKLYSSKKYLNQHMRLHTGRKLHHCTLCPSSFLSPCQLREHTRVHTGERPFQCPLCPKTWSKKSNLHGHLKNVHKLETLDIMSE